ncbi:MAG: phospho-sugar mutase [Chlamydiia bacterium]|nr:phospho-sugar mutase [Chlamydiia bacterium]
MTQTLDIETKRNVDVWLEGEIDASVKEQIYRQLDEDPKGVVDAFYTKLAFGTGGLRGVMGIGSNRMNLYTVQMATQGLANYIKAHPAEGKSGVLIGYDSRRHSRAFAEMAARVLLGNEIPVFLCQELRPTPFVSFGCREKKCQAAIMITASHNPPEYNGYKVYWDDGGQVLPPHDLGIIAEVNQIANFSQVIVSQTFENHPLLKWITPLDDEKYLRAITPLQHYPEVNRQEGNKLKVVYTSLHGTGITLVPRALAKWGFTNVLLVEDQVIPDADFPTCPYPNPEDPAALKLGIEVLLKQGGDLLIATDPDADRVGIAVKHQGEVQLLTGNQVACLCVWHVCHALTEQGRMPDNSAFVKTIVTSELFRTIVEAHGKTCVDVLTGFKYIAEVIRNWEEAPDGLQYLFGGEESYGYLLGTHARDKDAVVVSALLCEMALQAKREGITLVDRLHQLYAKYGTFVEKLHSLNFPESKAGKEQMTAGMTKLREKAPQTLANIPIVAIDDYLTATHTNCQTGEMTPITLPKSNVLAFWLEDNTKIMIRPSGTEPKIKIYCGVKSTSLEAGEAHAHVVIQSVVTLFDK